MGMGRWREGRAEWVNETVLAGCWICGFEWSWVDVVLDDCVDGKGRQRARKCGSYELVGWIVTSGIEYLRGDRVQ